MCADTLLRGNLARLPRGEEVALRGWEPGGQRNRLATSQWSRQRPVRSAQLSGVRFSYKTFRATFCQLHVDRDPRLLSVVSKAMRHTTTKTTELYYGRVRTDRAFAELENLYAAPNVRFSK